MSEKNGCETVMDALMGLCEEFRKMDEKGWEEGRQRYSDEIFDFVSGLHDKGFWYMIPNLLPGGGLSFECCGFRENQDLEFTATAKPAANGLEVSAWVDGGETEAPEIAAALKECLESHFEDEADGKKAATRTSPKM